MRWYSPLKRKIGRRENPKRTMIQIPKGKKGAGADWGSANSTWPMKVRAIAAVFANMYSKPTAASAGMGYDTSTEITMVAETKSVRRQV